MKDIVLITGGQRSGKSSYAQVLAKQKSDQPVYLATARIWDEDFQKRIEKHKSDRGEEWINIEIEKDIHLINMDEKTILLDCITLWLTNIFHDNKFNIQKSLEQAKKIWDAFLQLNNQLVIVTNELGMGIHAENEASRKFSDLQGWMNQYIVAKCSEVYLMISGIPVKIK